MSDGPSYAARAAHQEASRFMDEHHKGIERAGHATSVPEQGTVLLLYEEWLDHIIELVTDRKVVERWVATCYRGTHKLIVTDQNWPVGYYRDHRLPEDTTW